MEIFDRIHEITSLTSAFMPAQIVLTANRMDLFTRLDGKTLTAQQLAGALGTDPRATGLLCDALTALGFLEKETAGYRNSATSAEFLVRGRPYYVGDNLRHQANSWERWSKLEEAIRSGKALPKRTDSRAEEAKKTRDFALAMANIGQLTAAQVVEGLDLRRVSRMVDIGGGPGTYAMEFATQNPHLHVTLFDRPEVVAIAQERIRQAGLEERVATRPGDCFEDDLGSDYDLAFISNVLHIFGPEQIAVLLRKVRDALVSHGTLVVKDFFVNEDRTGPVFAAQFALHMLLNTESGTVYTRSELNAALEEAGFSWLSSFQVGQHSTVVVAEKED
ncbi:MAG: methyltransferase [Calditrichaeota bacterium]|nr:MAG: methyltransferase [Calditrichota bacterium]